MANPAKSFKAKVKELEKNNPGAKLVCNSSAIKRPDGILWHTSVCKFTLPDGQECKESGSAETIQDAENAACRKIFKKVNPNRAKSAPHRQSLSTKSGNSGPTPVTKAPLLPPSNIRNKAPSVTTPPSFPQNMKPTVPNGMTRVYQAIIYNKKKLLSPDTTACVYEGYFEVPTKKAAVKKLSNDLHLNQREIEVLIFRKIDHPNIVRYFITEVDPTGDTFMAMELAQTTLEKAIQRNQDKSLLRNYLIHSTTGLIALHQQYNIVHRDIKPSNILIINKTAKLADFGISKELKSIDMGTMTEPRGTPCWMPPEALIAIDSPTLKKNFRMFPNCDIFSLGLTMFYTSSKCKHPFGDALFERMGNIINSEPNWNHLASDDNIKLRNLVEAMLHKIPDKRPDSKFLLEHPYFWDNKKCTDFINAVGNDLKSIKSQNIGTYKTKLQNQYQIYCNKSGKNVDWRVRLCPQLKNFIEKRKHPKKYTGGILHLVEFIRDHDQHYDEWINFPELLSSNVFGKDGCDYITYFINRFPELITILYTYFQDGDKQGLKLKEFYKFNRNSCFGFPI